MQPVITEFVSAGTGNDHCNSVFENLEEN